MPWNRTDGGLYADHDGKRSCKFPSFEGTDGLSFGVGRKVAGSKDREVLAVQQSDVGADSHQRTVGYATSHLTCQSPHILLLHRPKTIIRLGVAIIHRPGGVMSPEHDNCRRREHSLEKLIVHLSPFFYLSPRHSLRGGFHEEVVAGIYIDFHYLYIDSLTILYILSLY